MKIILNQKKIFTVLLVIISFLLLMNIVGVVGRYVFHLEECIIFRVFETMFNFNMERNIPTFYSSFALLCSSVLLLIIALKHKSMHSYYLDWFVLALIFLFLSFDEFIGIHERLTDLTRQQFNTSGLFYYAWVIPYGIMLIIFIGIYIPFLLKLPKKIMILFILSGTIFVSGAIGFEMFGGLCAEKYGQHLIYAVFYTIEELFEMLGIVLFIYTLLSYINNQFESLTVIIKGKIL